MICLALLLPMAINWLTQSWGLRENNNYLRFLTGGILGIGVALFLSIEAPYLLKITSYISVGIVIAIVGTIGKLKSSTAFF
jgi:hypothetical protein